MRRLVVVSAIAMVMLYVGSAPAFGSGNTLNGTFTLTSDVSGPKSNCYGSPDSGYDDIRQGVQVLVRNDSNKILAKGQLGKGAGVALPGYPSLMGSCVFSFKINNVPSSNFYSIEVGHRGALTYSKKELDKKRWKVGFSLG